MGPIDQNIVNLGYDIFFNPETLNCFSDASMRKISKVMNTCAGSIAVCCDNIVDELCTVTSDCTVPAAELRGIRNSLSLAYKWRNQFRVINLFSDSLISIYGLRDSIYKWRFNYNDGSYYLKNNIVKNQELIIECNMLVQELQRNNNIVNIFHQKGHVKNDIQELREAIETFKRSNHFNGKVDYNFIRSISTYNNYIDEKTRSIIKRVNLMENYYQDPIYFLRLT